MDAISEPLPHDVLGSRAKTPPLVGLSAPVVYSLIVPFALTDLWVSLYQAICFPIYRIERVKRDGYFRFDREKLPYLNVIEKFNCRYCAYVSGVIAYAREVAARTEQYWCPIKHAEEPASPHAYYSGFAEHGDAGDFLERKGPLRAALKGKATAEAPSARTVTPAVRPIRRL